MQFNEQNHTYYNEEGELYIGTTSFIKKFSKPFEREKIAAKFAKKHKKTVQEVIDEWTKLGEDAIKKGTAYHKLMEDELLQKETVLIDEEEHPIFKSNWNEGVKINNISKLEPGVYPEIIVWSDRYKIAGQADYVEITKGGKINILDYKTSKEIKLTAFERWDGTKEMMKFPLTNFEDCNFNHYSLQLNLYAFLIKQHNKDLTIGSLKIEQIVGTFDEGVFEIENKIIYDIPNLQSEIRILLEYYKNKQ